MTLLQETRYIFDVMHWPFNIEAFKLFNKN